MPLAEFAGATARARSTKPRREKMFGEGRLVPLDREAKNRIKVFARALSHRTEEGKHWGIITAKFLCVLDALLFGFHNATSGRCFPSYETIAERAACARSTVYEAINALERAGILSWVNRIKRVREWGPDLFGRAQNRWRVIRTSNAYTFNDPKPPAKPPNSSKSESQTGTTGQDSNLLAQPALNPENRMHNTLLRLGGRLKEQESAAQDAAKSLTTKKVASSVPVPGASTP